MVILVVALIVLGPKRLPQAGRQVGRALAEFRRVTSDVKSDLQEALAVDELRDAFGVAGIRDELGLDGLRDSFDLRKVFTEPPKPVSPGGPVDRRSTLDHRGSGTYADPESVPPPDGLLFDVTDQTSAAPMELATVPPPPPPDLPDALQGLYATACPVEHPLVGL